jgi:transcriptional regulator
MGKDSNKDALLPGTLEMLVLKTLTRARLHGYGIAQYIRQVSDDVLQVEEGSLYPALQRLQLKGWVTSEWGLTENNRRARYYRLTPLGRKQLAAESASYERLIEAIARVMNPAQ